MTRDCRVCYRDPGGVEHGVRVTAVNRYHAFGLAMHEMRRCSWCNPGSGSLQRMTVEVRIGDRLRRIAVAREAFEEWAKVPPRPGERWKVEMLMLLGRMDPDRDFKRGIRMR